MIRDAIQDRVETLVDTRLDAIRSDTTAHRLRLAELLPVLAEEFEPLRTPAEIRACADAILSRYDDAAVRSHVHTLVHARARECLRHESCDALAVA